MKLIPARCPSCGANIEVNRDYETTKCKYCDTKVIIDDAIAKYKIEIENMPTAKNYLKIATRNIESGEYQKALEYLEKAAELDADHPDIIIKNALIKVLIRDITEKDFNNLLFAIKEASNYCSKTKLDEYIMYCINIIDKKRISYTSFLAGNIYEGIFLKTIYKYILFMNFYEKIFRNYINSKENKILILKKILGCIQMHNNGGKYLIQKGNSKPKYMYYKAPPETQKSLDNKKKMYEEELFLLDENYKNYLKRSNDEIILNSEVYPTINKPIKKAEPEFGHKIANIILLSFNALMVLGAIITPEIGAFIFFLLAGILNTATIIVLYLKLIPKKLLTIIMIGEYILVGIFMFIAILFLPYTFEGEYISNDGNTIITVDEEKIRIKDKTGKKTYNHSFTSTPDGYILETSNITYKYFDNTEKICLYENEKCIEEYNKKDAE